MANRWYEQVYTDRLKMDSAFGYIPVNLGNAIWRVRVILIFGTATAFVDRNLGNCGNRLGSDQQPASFNVLCTIDGLSQGLASRLEDADLESLIKLAEVAYKALIWRETLPPRDLFVLARGDYGASTEDVVGHRSTQARWGAQQAVEKTLKGLLEIAGASFPTGSKGHDLLHLARLLQQSTSIATHGANLEAALCSPKVRYGEEPSTDIQALNANHAVLRVLSQLAESPLTRGILKKHQSVPSDPIPLG